MIKKNDKVRVKPEHLSAAEIESDWDAIAIDDEEKGRVTIEWQCDLPFKPTEVINVNRLLS